MCLGKQQLGVRNDAGTEGEEKVPSRKLTTSGKEQSGGNNDCSDGSTLKKNY